MSERFREIYHVGTNRCPGHDYSSPGVYFVTICTRKKISYFGEIRNCEMVLSGTGIIVQDFWLAIPDHFPNVRLDEFVIMPDHVHGIIIIKSGLRLKLKLNDVKTPKLINVETPNLINVETPKLINVETPKLINVETPNLGVSIKINSSIQNLPDHWSESFSKIINFRFSHYFFPFIHPFPPFCTFYFYPAFL